MIFSEEYKFIEYAEVTPQAITGNTEYNKVFFTNLDNLENKILDGQSFSEAVKENNLKITKIDNININKENKTRKKIDFLSDNLFKKIYFIKNEKTPEIINVDNKYFLAVIQSIEKNIKPIDNPDVLKALKAQLNFKTKIDSNTSILKDMNIGGFDRNKFEAFAEKNKLEVKDYKISNLKQNEIFSEGIIKRIFLTKDSQVDLITNSSLTKNFLILAVDTEYKELKKSSAEFERYEAKARLDIINKIYQAFDNLLNQKYKVKLNQKTIDRLKNSF